MNSDLIEREGEGEKRAKGPLERERIYEDFMFCWGDGDKRVKKKEHPFSPDFVIELRSLMLKLCAPSS